jgi:RHS repeat-associated protein
LGVHALGQLNLNYLAIIGAQRGLTLGDSAHGTIANTQIIYNDMGVVLSGNTSAVTLQTTAIAANRVGIVCDACSGTSALINNSSIYANSNKNLQVLGSTATGTIRVNNNWWDKTTAADITATLENTAPISINTSGFLSSAPVLIDPALGNNPLQLQNLSIEYYHADGFNSPIVATNATGAVLWQEHYQPFGETRLNQDPNPTINYTGHALDRDSGLIYAGARYLDPTIGRFMSTGQTHLND